MSEHADHPVSLPLTRDDLMLINNALNEVCNGVDLDDAEFEPRLDVSREEARALLHRVSDWLRRAAV